MQTILEIKHGKLSCIDPPNRIDPDEMQHSVECGISSECTMLATGHFGEYKVSIDFSLSVKAATLMFISGRGLAISSATQGKSGSIYNLVKK